MARIYGLVMQAIKSTIGQKADAASASGSALARLGYITANNFEAIGAAASVCSASASNNIKVAADTERTTTAPSGVKLKEIKCVVPGVVRISYDAKVAAGVMYVSLSKGAAGTRNVSAQTWTTYTEDVTNVKGDSISLSAYTSGHTGYVRNFRALYDAPTAPVASLD